MASSGNAPGANNLLSPNAAFEQVARSSWSQEQEQQRRRKSTLSANGFFIDYSCTRRRSSAVREHQQQHKELLTNRSQFISSYVSPVRLPARAGSFSVAAGQAASQPGSCSNPNSNPYPNPNLTRLQPTVSGGRQTRASYSAASSSNANAMATSHQLHHHRASVLVPTLYAPSSALAGSRKTSIFDPAGHSIMAPHLNARRKSTMVTGANLIQSPIERHQQAATQAASSAMLSVARTAAKAGGRHRLKGELVQHVPVIGCSPTSIQASLSALEETRRYEKLLRRLKSHKERKEKRRRARNLHRMKRLQQQQQQQCLADPEEADFDELQLDDARYSPSKATRSVGLRRRSIKVIKEAASMLSGGRKWAHDSALTGADTMEDLSLSSISQFSSSTQTSLASLDRYEINNDELFVDENTLVNFNEPAAGQSSGVKKSTETGVVCKTGKRSLVKSAMKKVAASIATSGTSKQLTAQQHSTSKQARSMSVAALNYRYYYYYLRENSLDAIDDLPVSCVGGSSGKSAFANDTERRAQLHINYSLARIQILNSTSDPASELANRWQEDPLEPGRCSSFSREESPLKFDFNQSTDALLTMSTTSRSSSSAESLTSGPLDAQRCQRSSVSTTSISPSSGSSGAARQRRRRHRRPGAERRASDPAADDECTSADLELHRKSRATRKHSASSRKTHSGRLRPEPPRSMASSKRKSTSGELVAPRWWREEQEQQQQQQQQHSRSAGNSSRRRAAGSEGRSQNNLAGGGGDVLEVTKLAREQDGWSGASLPKTAALPNADVSDEDEPETDSDDTELDDFERLNRSHRGYKPPPALSFERAEVIEERGDVNRRLRPTKSLKCRNTSSSSSFRLAKRVGSFIIGRIGGEQALEKSFQANKRNYSLSSGTLAVSTERPTTCNGSALRAPDAIVRGGVSPRATGRRRQLEGATKTKTKTKTTIEIETPSALAHLSGPSDQHRSNHHKHQMQSARQRAAASCSNGGGNNKNNNNNNNDKDNHKAPDQANRMALVYAQREGEGEDYQHYCNSHLRAVQRASGPTRPASCDCHSQYNLAAANTFNGASGSTNPAARTRSQSSLINLGRFQVNYPRDTPSCIQTASSMLRLPDCEGRPQSGARSRRCLSATLTVSPALANTGGPVPEVRQQLESCSCNDIIVVQGDGKQPYQETGQQRGAAAYVCRLCAANDNKAEEMNRLAMAVDNQLASSPHQSIALYGELADLESNNNEIRSPFGRVRAYSSSTGSGSGAQISRPTATDYAAHCKFSQDADVEIREGKVDERHWQRTDIRLTNSSQTTVSLSKQRQEDKHLARNSEAFRSTRLDCEHERELEVAASKPPLGRRRKSPLSMSTSEANEKNDDDDRSASGSNHDELAQLTDGPGTGTNAAYQEDDDEVDKKEEAEEEEDEDERLTMDLLKKGSFTCMLVGARQSGKRSIVKCFVKLLNEFKLALDEYRKEKMFAKLMDCSERLQALSDQQEERLRLQAISDQQLDRRLSGFEQVRNWQRARGNSWLIGSPRVDRWFKLSSMSGGAAKRRLNSMVASNQSAHLFVPGSEPANQQRRHTTIEHDSLIAQQQHNFKTSQDRFLTVANEPNKLSPCNKSDFNIDYQGASGSRSRESIAMQQHQLQVPSKSLPGQEVERRSSTRTSTGTLRPSATGDTRRSMQFLVSPSSPDNDQSVAGLRPRNQSIQVNGKRVPMLSLKELNKRRIRIKFKTRRQLSDKYQTILNSNNQDNSEDKSNKLSYEREKNNPKSVIAPDLPDSFMVVYSVNDRESFDYAKALIGQLRSIKREYHVPIVLVANKIDLERAKVIKSEEGRMLARKNVCKFMETSCTVGFNLDNLLVGLRTQLILKHHTTINSILRYGKACIDVPSQGALNQQDRPANRAKGADNILVRFYKRYLMDNEDLNYECDNFSKL